MDTERPPPARSAPGRSLRQRLLVGILVPVIAAVALGATVEYRAALDAADTAYDRTLLASAKAIGEQLEVQATSGKPVRLIASLPYSALEAFEADNRSRMYYKVLGFEGEMVSGFAELPMARPAGEARSVYAALVHFYDDQFRGQPVRMAVLLQPVAGVAGQGVATIQVAETLELRQGLARSLLAKTLLWQALLIALIAGVVAYVVQSAMQPVRALSQNLRERAETDLSPLPSAHTARELQPFVEATNALMARVAHLLAHQKRFVRDASHQLRTPLAVLKTQVQSARRGDVDAATALAEIDTTVSRATELANQMLALAKVEQLRQQGQAPVLEWSALVRAVALDLSPLIAQAHIEFELQAEPLRVRAHDWALRELTRNLLHNAIKAMAAAPAAPALLTVQLKAVGAQAHLRITDTGPGLSDDARERLFQPFAASGHQGGSGLGLAICHEIVLSLGGHIELNNRSHQGQVQGLDAIVQLPRQEALS